MTRKIIPLFYIIISIEIEEINEYENKTRDTRRKGHRPGGKNHRITVGDIRILQRERHTHKHKEKKRVGLFS